MQGLLGVLKPPGMTSHDVVNVVRRIIGSRRVGHAGTLDPGAAGVLVIGVGRATRLLPYMTDQPKRYVAEICFGAATTTHDAEGEVVSRGDASNITLDHLQQVCAEMTGDIEQVPPMYSAVKQGGQRLYQLAREGREVPRTPRKVTIFSLEVLDFRPGPEALARLRMECSKGVYVRTVFHDIGESLGVPAHMGFLVRTAVGPVSVDRCQTFTELENRPVWLPLAECFPHLHSVSVDRLGRERLLHGNPVRLRAAELPAEGVVRVLGPAGELLALGRLDHVGGKTLCRPLLVIARHRGLR